MGWSSTIDDARILLRSIVGTDDVGADATGTNRLLLVIGGISEPTSTRAAQGDWRALNVNRFGGLRPERMNVLIGTITSSTATTTAQVGSVLNIGHYCQALVIIDQTGATGDTNSTTLFLESKLDGTSWFGIAASTISAAATAQAIMLTKEFNTAGIVTALSALPGPGTIRNSGFADDLRVRYTVTGDTAAVSFRVWVNLIG